VVQTIFDHALYIKTRFREKKTVFFWWKTALMQKQSFFGKPYCHFKSFWELGLKEDSWMV
jgi:hypothetical protein